jgi:hypothetical protein
MKNLFLKMTPLEISVVIIMVLYVIFKVDTPEFMAKTIDSPIGLLTVLVTIMFLFYYANPVIAILFIFVAYELIRRTSYVSARDAIMKHTPTQRNKDIQMKVMNPPSKKTLEEEMVSRMAPVGKSEIGQILDTKFKPVAPKLEGASKL